MRDDRPHSRPVSDFKQAEGYQTAPWDDMPQMQALFEKFAGPGDWNFLDVMAAISEMVGFYTNHDINQEDPICDLLKMSQNKCRFCT
ncbi:hypothetical protein KAR91_83420 [Candidatus Pacearchaeota archaeon]|nr:hypothetical protein [Candidatus Pacearchaeota archaeon]